MPTTYQTFLFEDSDTVQMQHVCTKLTSNQFSTKLMSAPSSISFTQPLRLESREPVSLAFNPNSWQHSADAYSEFESVLHTRDCGEVSAMTGVSHGLCSRCYSL